MPKSRPERARDTVMPESRPETLPVEVRGLALDAKERPVVLLEDQAERVLPIWIGVFEATAIQMALEEIDAERPLTHDLLKSLVDALEADCVEIRISALRDNTYFAEIHLRSNRGLRKIDSRPSDALALAVRCGCSILVARDVFEKGHVQLEASEEREEDALRRRLEEIDPEDLGKYTM